MERISDLEREFVNKVLDRPQTCLSGFYKNPLGGPSVQDFETDLAEYVGVEHAIAVSNGTTALHAALLACGVRPGDHVITTPLTFSATATAILMCGARPIFVDVDIDTYNLDPDRIANTITDKTKAIIPVHLLGTPCDMGAIIDETKGDIYIIEDNAQALGASYKGLKTGSIGDVSTVSFQETKTISTAGEGGAIFTNSSKLAQKCRYLRNHGSQYGRTPYLTYNYRMTEIQAAFGVAQLIRLDEFLKNQMDNAQILLKALPPSIQPQVFLDDSTPTRYIVGCTVDDEIIDRERVINDLTQAGINKGLPGASVGLGYTHTLMEFPILQEYYNQCENAEALCCFFIWFDVTRFKTKEETKRIVGEIVKCVSLE